MKNEFFVSKIKKLVGFKDHTQKTTCLCLTHDNRVASCSWDQTINIYNLKTFEVEIIISGHNAEINHISLTNKNYLISSSFDSSVIIWEIAKRHYQRIFTFNMPTSRVLMTLQLSGKRFGSCLIEGVIQIWKDSHPYNLITTLKTDEDPISSFSELKTKNLFVSLSYFESFYFWDNKNYQCVKKIVRPVQLENFTHVTWTKIMEDLAFSRHFYETYDKLVTASLYKIFIFNLNTFQIETIITKDKASPFGPTLFLKNGNFLIGTIGKILQISKNEYKVIDFKLVDYEIHDLVLKNDYLISCSDINWESQTDYCVSFEKHWEGTPEFSTDKLTSVIIWKV